MSEGYYVRFGDGCWVSDFAEVRGAGEFVSVDKDAIRYESMDTAMNRAKMVGGEVVRRVPNSDYTYEVV